MAAEEDEGWILVLYRLDKKTEAARWRIKTPRPSPMPMVMRFRGQVYTYVGWGLSNEAHYAFCSEVELDDRSAERIPPE